MEQQRQEQARFQASLAPPEQPVDPAEFVRNLNPTLRRQVLADMDDTVLAVLPQDLATEAQGLRRELEQRQLHFHDRNTRTDTMFSQLLRHSGLGHRAPGGGFHFARLIPRGNMSSWRVTDRVPLPNASNKKVGRQLLDPESLTCLLILLFLNDSSLNASRLHRILRNLSYHNWTKQWITYALIAILRRTSSFNQENSCKQPIRQGSSSKSRYGKRERKVSADSLCEEITPSNMGGSLSVECDQWLSRTLNLAFGGCINIFQLQKVGKHSNESFVTVHAQACLDVCKQTLEALSFLAKNFPASFAPFTSSTETDKTKEKSNDESNVNDANIAGSSTRGSVNDPNIASTSMSGTLDKNESSEHEIDPHNDFWDVLVRLNSSGPGRKGKAPLKSYQRDTLEQQESTSFVSSPLGQLLSMLSHPVIKQNTTLTDKLLRLLAVISMSLPERPKELQARPVTVEHASTAAGPPGDDERGLSDGDSRTEHLPVIPHRDIHTVTFADADIVLQHRESPRDILPGEQSEASDYDPHHTTEASTICSETASLTSSLFVEGSPTRVDSHSLPDVRSPQTESVVSALSDGTVAQSDFSGVTGDFSGADALSRCTENIHADQHIDAMEIDTSSHQMSDSSSVTTGM